MGVGFFFLSTRWLTIVLAATGLGWGGVVWTSSSSPLWPHFGFALLTAGVLAVLVHTVRLHTHRRLVQLSLQDAERLRILTPTAQHDAVGITQHEQTEQALRESEAQYRDLIESTHDMIHSAALDGRVLFVNRAWLTTLGYEPSDVPQLTVFDIIHPDSRAQCQQVLSRVAAGESVDGLQTTFVTKAGRAIPVEGNVTARWVAGTVIGTQGFFRDVSERHQAKAALRQREEYFRVLIENASDVITVMGSDGTFHYQSPVAEQLLGHRLADAGRQAAFPFVHPDDTAKAEATFVAAVQQPGVKIQTELRLQHQDGSWRTVEATAFNLLHSPAVGGIVVNLHDITERKQVEEALRAAKEYADLLIHSSLDMIIAVDAQRRITEFNRAAEHAFGYRKAEVLGQPVSLLYTDPAEGMHVHHHTRQEDGVAFEVRNKRKTGEEFDAYVAASVMRDPSGQVVGVMGISRDITEQKRADAELRQSKEAAEAANRAKLEFFGHDVA